MGDRTAGAVRVGDGDGPGEGPGDSCPSRDLIGPAMGWLIAAALAEAAWLAFLCWMAIRADTP
jgi:hypothetical protein